MMKKKRRRRLRCDHTTKHGIKKKDTTTYQQPNFLLFEMINIVYIKNQTLVFQFNKVTNKNNKTRIIVLLFVLFFIVI